MWCLGFIISLLMVNGETLSIEQHSEGTGKNQVFYQGGQNSFSKGENEVTNRFANDIDLIKKKLFNPINNNVAKNVILFLGDGMSVATITAARIYLGQINGGKGEENQFSFEKFPYTGLSKTYCIDSQVADSACTSTAYMTGVKNNIGTIGVTQDVSLGNCTAMQNTSFHTHSIVEWAQASGKGTGLVTTTSITDASPTGGYAHTANRDWQTDTDVAASVKDSPELCEDIAKQLVKNEPGKSIKVILGGGSRVFIPKTKKDVFGETGYRTSDLDLIDEWKKDKVEKGNVGKFIWQRNQLLELDLENTDYVLGLFDSGDMDYHLDENLEQPSLGEMTRVAIRMLQKENKGYFLFVEGGLIDNAHHGTRARKALDETIEFHKAIEVALNLTEEEDTLIIVTADHSHTMSISGYPVRGSNILTTIQEAGSNLPPYSTLSYANGPTEKHNISTDLRDDKDYHFPTAFYKHSETHGGDDVAVYARGPSAYLLSGNYEQTYIAHVMAYASRIGPAAETINNTANINQASVIITILLIISINTIPMFLL